MSPNCIERAAGGPDPLPRSVFALLVVTLLLGGCATPLVEISRNPTGCDDCNTQETAAAALPTPPPSRPLPRGTERRFEAALGALLQDDEAAAEAGFRALTESHPALYSPWFNLGLVLLRDGRDEEALDALAEAARRDPLDCRALVMTGVTHRRHLRFDAARAAYDACLERDGSHPAALRNLAMLNEIYLGDLEQAATLYARYQATLPEPDRRVSGWIADLGRRIEQAGQVAANGRTR